jgi:hypothetical protein
MLSATTKLIVLTTVLGGASLTLGSVAASGAVPSAHLSSSQVSRIALEGLEKAGYGPADFRAQLPSFEPEKARWFVYFLRVERTQKVDGHYEAYVPVDSEMLVVVDDVTGHVCVQQAMAVGPCT